MLPEILTLKGFLSYREKQTLDFRSFHIALISGENGQGKSSLLDAMTFALFGKARGVEGNRSGTDDLVTNGETYMEVMFQFLQNEKRYRIIRSFNKTKRHSDVRLETEKDGTFVNSSENSIRETEAKIRDILGMDYDAFVTSSFIMQGKADFFTVKKKEEKIEILRQILGLELYEKAKQKAAEKINTINGEISSTENQISRLEEDLKDMDNVKRSARLAKETLEKIEKEKAALEEETEKLRKKYGEAKIITENIKNAEKEISEIKKRIEELGQRIEESIKEKQKLSEIIGRKEEIEKGYAEFTESRKTLHILLEKQSETEKLKSEKQKILSDMETEKMLLKSKLESNRKAISDRERELKENKKESDNLEKQIEENKKKEEKLQKDIEKLSEEVGKLKKDAEKFEEKLKTKEKLLMEKEKILSNGKIRRESAQKKLEELLTKLNALTAKKKKFGTMRKSEAIKNEIENLKRTEESLREKRGSLKEKISELKSKINSLKIKLEEINEKDKLITEDTARCPLCGSPLSEEHRAEIKLRYKTEREQTKREIEELSNEKSKTEKAVSELEKETDIIRAKIRNKENELIKITSLESTLKEISTQTEETEKEIEQTKKLLSGEFLTEAEKENLSRIENRLSKLSDVSEELLRPLKEALVEKENALNDAKSALQEIQKILIKIREKQNALYKRNITLTSEIEELKRETSKITQTLSSRDFQKEKIEKLNFIQSKIESIGFDENELNKCREKNKILSKFEELHGELERAQVNLKNIEKVISERTKEKEETEKELEKRLLIKEELANNLKKFEGTEEALIEKKAKYEEITRKYNEAVKESAKLEENLRNLKEKEKKLAELVKSTEEKKREKKILTVCKEMFGRDGIQLSIIRNALPQIENIANEMLGRMTNNMMSLKFDTVKQLKSRDKTVNTLEISVYANGEKRRYELFSGGEQFRINLAIRIAISMYLSVVRGKPLEMLVIDEGFGSQDDNGKLRILEEINSFKEKFKKIIIITHVSDIKENFPYEIHITKENGSSHISIR